MSKNNFGEWLQSQRRDKRLSLRALAQSAGVGRSTLSDWEAGKSLPRLPELEAVCSTLDVSPEERQTVLREMETPRALQRLQSESSFYYPDFVERAGHLPHGGDLLKALRLRNRWTLQEAAQRMEVRQTTLGRWEKGEHFPDAAKLQTVCFVYGASEQEIVALTCGRYSLDHTSSALLPPEALEHRFRTELEPLELSAEIHPGKEAAFLSMEAALYPHALRNKTVRPLLAEVYAHHANYLRNWRLDSETYASRSLALVPRSQKMPYYAALAVVSASDEFWERTHDTQGQVTNWLNRWLKWEFPPFAMSWMLRKFSGLLRVQGDFDGARAQLRRAEVLPPHDKSDFDHVEVCRYHAMTLLWAFIH